MHPPLDLTPILTAARAAVHRARLAPGRYARWLPASGQAAKEPNPYGCADAANILYTLGEFPSSTAERSDFATMLQSWQDAGDGLFREATHHPIHVTAHCIAALELFEARPLHPLRGLHPMLAPPALAAFLDNLAWHDSPWNASHQGAGIYAALVLAGEASPAWEDAYFSWLDTACDPPSGFWRRGHLPSAEPAVGAPWFHHLAGSFHYLFNYEAARRPHPHPAAMIDTCLRLRAENAWPTLGATVGFAEIDWVYCLTRARRQTPHRFAAVTSALADFAAAYVVWLDTHVRTTAVPFDDLHTLFGTLCALAELQSALPGKLRSDRPLRLVLDRRPFI